MKNIIFFLLFPVLSFSQTNEKQEKQEIKNNSTNSNNRNAAPQTYNTKPYTSEYSQKILERNKNTQRSYSSPIPNRNTIIYDPYWNYGGWGFNRWNPTLGWNSYSPYFWYDSWGFRNPGRVYVYENGKKDTIRRESIHGSFGLQYNTKNEYGIFAIFGKKTYFITEYSQTNNNYIGTYYPLLTLDRVLPWDDRKLPDEIRSNMFYLGFGKKLDKRVGVHASLGFGKEIRRYKFYDELFVLSNNGEYTFPNYTKNITTVKLGTTIDISRNLLTKLDFDFGRGCISYGLGLRF